ncbi:MAG: S9 family peptidase [Acidobacteriota bacterium]|nr:S9 family peptidase [Acidobacteriota bacterium]
MQSRWIRILCFLAFAAGVPACGYAQNSGKSCGLTPEQALTLRRISGLRFSPKGDRLAVVVGMPPKTVLPARHIWVYDVASGGLRQFTDSPKSEFDPQWSPDGKRLAFLSDRNGPPSLYVMPTDGGEARPLLEKDRAVSSFSWSPDGTKIALIGPDPETAAEKKKKEEKKDAFVVDQDDRLPRLWIADVASGGVRAISPERWRVSSAGWLPAGDALIVSATSRPQEDYPTNRIYRVDAASGKTTEISAPRGPFGNLHVSPDGKSVAYLASAAFGPAPHDLYLQPLDGRDARDLTGTSINRVIESYEWRPDGSLMAMAQMGFEDRIYDVGTNGSAKALAKFAVNPMSFTASASGMVAFVGETSTAAPELWVREGHGAARKVSDFNKDWAGIELSPLHVVHYKSFDGLEIEAGLYYPCGTTERTHLPTIFLIHGGPTGAWRDSINTWAQLLTARGYAVFTPNVRGSTGYGEKFVDMNRADWGGKDFRDVMAGVDDLVARGVADANRLGITGWSYGGYMTEWAITQTNRFKAAVAGGGMTDLLSEFGTEDIPGYDSWFWGWSSENPYRFLQHSPLVFAKNVKTPLLMVHGENDPIDPIGQDEEFYRALKYYGTAVELVKYPREPHGFQEKNHQLDWQHRMLDWFAKYMPVNTKAN